MKKRVSVAIISCFIVFSQFFAIAVEEQTFREELDAHQTETVVSYEKYREALLKFLEPRGVWDADLRYLLFPLAAIALGVVIAFFVRQIRVNLIAETSADISDTPHERVETEKAALAHAEMAEAVKDFRNALRFLYLSAILHLQERQLLPYDKSLTNREYLRQAQVDVNLQTTLADAIAVFDAVWYGHKPCDAETLASYRELLQKVYAMTPAAFSSSVGGIS